MIQYIYFFSDKLIMPSHYSIHETMELVNVFFFEVILALAMSSEILMVEDFEKLFPSEITKARNHEFRQRKGPWTGKPNHGASE